RCVSGTREDAPRVVHLDTERGWRGGERQVLWLAEQLARTGHCSMVAARSGEPLVARAAAAGLAVVRCDPRMEFDPRAALRLRAMVRHERMDIVHAHTAHAVALGAMATAGTAAELVVTRRVDFALRNNGFTRWKYGRASTIIAISGAVRDALIASGVGAARIAMVTDGIPLDRRIAPASVETLAALGVPAGIPLVVMVAALVQHKDPLTFVSAVNALRRRVPAARALLVGDGPLRRAVQDEISRLGLGDVLMLTGYRTDADALIAAAGVVVLSSEQEGMGSVLLDAMALGKPVAATTAGGIPDIVIDAETGLLVPPHDGAALGEAIARLLTDAALAERLGRAGAARVQRFSMERTAAATAAVYSRVLADRGRSR
ncbi:MAG: glycosyltransferase family 4 protein, partial [Gemmatimonadaceae bacterium]